MNSITLSGQGLMDMAIQEYGTIEAIVQIAFKNELSVTDELLPGSVLLYDAQANVNKEVAEYFTKNAIVPATYLSDGVLLILANEDPCNLCKCFT